MPNKFSFVNFANLPSSDGMGPGGYKTAKTYNKQVTLSDRHDTACGKQANSFILNANHSRKRGIEFR